MTQRNLLRKPARYRISLQLRLETTFVSTATSRKFTYTSSGLTKPPIRDILPAWSKLLETRRWQTSAHISACKRLNGQSFAGAFCPKRLRRDNDVSYRPRRARDPSKHREYCPFVCGYLYAASHSRCDRISDGRPHIKTRRTGLLGRGRALPPRRSGWTVRTIRGFAVSVFFDQGVPALYRLAIYGRRLSGFRARNPRPSGVASRRKSGPLPYHPDAEQERSQP